MLYHKIVDLTNTTKNICLSFIVIKEISVTTTKDKDIVRTYLISDETGSIEYSAWNIQFEDGDLINITGGYTSLFKGKTRLFNSKNSMINRNGKIRKVFSLEPFIN
ncbi:hypothetical protein CWI37_0379p0020 [Hamiltosporidium tvaerminnensis]|uniref:Uncharacterized protein n=1 Tax=Hamiltosporidium tvaerminnensis TaxID=1176355 RepID=A0A4Q9L7T2_9MICR|nr:SOSS complex subunit B1 [Hamiltosporidium tvaerminnensis]TBT98852.1 hypothetical protein CWI37_1568p0020 [Hamiltosporidium tvaerminnensis]TBU02981.1 hypothetical protein CWI37_0379p0020 [Hamiltosporidium tvaerminnensis]